MLSFVMFLAGVGLLLTGISLLSDALKRAGSRAFRRFSVRFMEPRWKALGLGVVSGALVQSTSAAMVILAGLNTAGAISLGQAVSILTGFSVGNCLMPFLISFDIHMAVYFFVGAGSILLYFVKQDRWRNILSIVFGLGLIFYGIEVMLDGVRPLRTEPWFNQALATAGAWPILSIIIGGALGFLTQSSMSVVVVAIGLAKGGILSGHDMFLIMYGAAIGSTLFKKFLGAALTGSGKQLVQFGNLYNFTGAGLFIVLDRIEFYFHVPLVLAFVSWITPNPAMQAALAFALASLSAAVIYTILHKPVVDWLLRQTKTSDAEALSKPQYLSGGHALDPATTLESVSLEQSRHMEQIAAFLTVAEKIEGSISLADRFDSSTALGLEIESALLDVSRLSLPADCAERLAVLQARQALILQLAAVVKSLAEIDTVAPRHPVISGLATACRESAEFLILHLVQMCTSTEQDWVLDASLYGDRGPLMRQMREAYLNANHDMGPEARADLLSMTLAFDKCTWLLGRIAGLERQPS